jgi:hypothetical protein
VGPAAAVGAAGAVVGDAAEPQARAATATVATIPHSQILEGKDKRMNPPEQVNISLFK